jgi:hypothetical protein
MKSTITLCLIPLFAAVLPAQGPPDGGREFGPRAFGGQGDSAAARREFGAPDQDRGPPLRERLTPEPKRW